MASGQTTNYGLNQWAAEDPVLRTDFNQDNAKLDAALSQLSNSTARKGNCQIVSGTYVGTGTCGKNTPNRLTFEARPLLLAVQGGWRFLTVRGRETAIAMSSSNNDKYNTVTWEDKAVSWYCTTNYEEAQCNTLGETYFYVALLEA